MSILLGLQNWKEQMPGSRSRRLMSMTSDIVQLSDAMSNWNDSQLLRASQDIGWKLRADESLRTLIPQVFALVREASRRALGMQHFPVQLYAGLIMAHGGIAEMETGEGKTLSALPAVCLRAMFGKGCHVLTTNDYLASRDAEFASAVLRHLGLTVGCVTNTMAPDERRSAYACDVTYGTEKEMGFDFLRDRLQQRTATSSNRSAAQTGVQRGHYFALIDEADSIMIDQARTPLLIAENQDCPAETVSLLYWSDRLSTQLQAEVDFRYRRESRSVSLTPQGVQRVILQSRPQRMSAFDPESLCRQVEKSLSAHLGFAPERDYVVIDGKIQIVDESTGRILEGRKWQNRLHQAIEVREKLNVSPITRETARISIQSFLRQYTHLAGMTGTAVQVQKELRKVYGVSVARVPVHQTCQRQGHAARVFLTMDAKLNAIVRDIAKLQQQGRAVLAGTPSVRASEMLSARLHEEKISHDLLHAKQDQHEASIVARAGQAGSVIVATNMAGRGTDIKISEDVRRLGGLHVIATEMHSSARIDRQLIGRAARRGDPGSFQFFVSFEDELLSSVSVEERLRYQRRLQGLSMGEVAAEHISFFKNAQRRIEQHHETQRRQMLTREKMDRKHCEELGLDPWLESFHMNQDDA